MAEESFEERNEAPSPKRRSDAREKGNVARSIEINSALVLLAAIFVLQFSGAWMLHESQNIISFYFQLIQRPELSIEATVEIAKYALYIFLKLSFPIALVIMIIGFVANIIQIGFLFTGHPLIPKLEKVDPIQGFKRMFSIRSFVEAFKSIAKFGIVSVVSYLIIKNEFDTILTLSQMSIMAIWLFLLQASFKLFLYITLVLIVLAILDYLYQRYEYEKNLRMTRQELKEERKQLEGDPLIKARIRSLQREMSRRRMMEEVPKATVVVTNPTHYAIALRYEPDEMEAPVVVAKGKEFLAQKIREIAVQKNIPVVEDKALVRAMYGLVNVGEPIPVQFFNAVAEIMAYVYKLKNKIAA